MHTRRLLIAGAVVALAAATVTAPATAEQETSAGRGGSGDRAQLVAYARDTWRSFEAMVDPATGLPADNVEGDLDETTRSRYTSPTNIGGYLWSTVVARELEIISRREAHQRMAQALDTVAGLDRHEASGMFYNWYDEATGAVVRIWPVDGTTVYPFLSSVDNGWFAAALRIVREAEPRLRDEAEAILDTMNFGFFYNPEARPDLGTGLIRGGFWDDTPPPDKCSVPPGPGVAVWFTCNHYDITVTEPRITSYLGIGTGQIPPEHYFATYRTFPDSCDWDWQEQQPVGTTRTYLGIDVFEGAYSYHGMRIVPSWGGDMFEALMPDLFVPEAQWGRRSWGVNHPLTVQAQIEHGEEAGYGYWGFSPASDPTGGYREFGVEELGMSSDGYASDLERTNVDKGYPGCREGTNPTPEFGDGVVTPHAAFLALPYADDEVLDNLEGIREELGAYGPGGFYDSVAVRSGVIAERYLSLDQAMVMGAIGNYLEDDLIKRYFVDRQFERAIRPLLAMEEFSARPRLSDG